MGLSMGGSLALRLAEHHGDDITGIRRSCRRSSAQRATRSPPAALLLQMLVGSFPGIRDDIAKPGQDEGAYDRIPLKAAHSLSFLWKAIKADIAKVTQPLVLFRSAVDHVVEPSNAKFILANVSSTDIAEVILRDSFHVATLDYDAEVIVRDSIAFVRQADRLIMPESDLPEHEKRAWDAIVADLDQRVVDLGPQFPRDAAPPAHPPRLGRGRRFPGPARGSRRWRRGGRALRAPAAPSLPQALRHDQPVLLVGTGRRTTPGDRHQSAQLGALACRSRGRAHRGRLSPAGGRRDRGSRRAAAARRADRGVPRDDLHARGLVQHPPRLRDDALAGLGQQHLARAALEELHAQFVLELLHRRRQARLAHEAALRRAAEVAFLGDGDDVLQFRQGHGFVSSQRHRQCLSAVILTKYWPGSGVGSHTPFP